MTQLVAGANVALPAQPLTLIVQAQGAVMPDLSAYLLAETTQQVRGDADMIFYNQLQTPNRSVVMQPGTPVQFQLSLDQVETAIGRIAICATLDGTNRFSSLQSLAIELRAGSQTIATGQLETARMNEAALILGEFYRRQGAWKFRLVGQGFEGGLQPLAEHPRVAEVRSGLGAVAAVQLADPAEALPFVKTLRLHGISGRAAGRGAMQISPTFVMTDDQVAEMAARILAALG